MKKFIDLHTHLRGTITPDIFTELAKKNNVNFSADNFLDESRKFFFKDFQDFLEKYDFIGKVVTSSEDLEMLAYRYLKNVSERGTIYVEFMHSPTHSIENGIKLEDQLDAISTGIQAAAADFGISATVIATAVRHAGPTKALELAERLSSLMHPIVSGFGLTGNELAFDVAEFSGAFYVAKKSGLGCTAHVGEWGAGNSVEEAVRELNLDRVGHGINAIDDPHVVERLASSDVGFEICLTSNHYLKGIRFADHPCGKLLRAGCKVTLATDDPGYFDTTPEKEYEIASSQLGLTDDELARISRVAIEMAFCSEAEKRNLLNLLAPH